MHKRFDHQAIEKKWQEEWKKASLYDVGARDHSKEKEYVLTEWPYPSGNLHVGHWYAFAVPDIYVRHGRMSGKQVLYPMGFDAFGLPAENAAIKRNVNPREWTESNIAYMREQLESMGNAFSWDKTTSSTDPKYYKWTQWMFAKFFEEGIAYRGEGVVNWCPGCHTVIANEQVLANGTCERSGDVIEKRTMPQWMLRITDFADELLDGLETVDWPEHIKEAQRQWIGRSKGAELSFELYFTHQPEANDNRGPNGEKAALTVFTTRPDTLYGVTYLVLAPEHPWVTLATDDNHTVLGNKEEVLSYVRAAKQKNDIERGDNTREKTGVELKGVKAINPATGEQIPMFVADYVLGGYGTGAIMAVPAHDERDNIFAKKFNLPIKHVVSTHYIHIQNDSIDNYRQGVYGLISKDDQYLVQHFTNKNFYWLPGGGVDEGETEHEALVRELSEETPYSNFLVKEKITVAYFDTVSDRTNESIRNQTNVYRVEIDLTQKSPTSFTTEEIEDGIELLWLTKADIQKLESDFEPERIQLILEAISAYEGIIKTSSGTLVNSNEFDGMDSETAKVAITEKVGGKMTNTYRLRDWSIGRQRYWGVPIPIVYDPEGKAYSIPKEHLPWILPEDVDFTPTGEPPLAKSKELQDRTERIFGAGWRPEVETMDTFVDSSWYFLRYLDNQNDEELASTASQRAWMQVDLYFGGAEHTTMHLLYSRFWQKALHRLGLAEHTEPYKMRINRGLILDSKGIKMSKSKGNVIDPDEQVKLVGADTVKMYLAFMGPYQGTNYPWDMGGIAGLRRFLERVNGLSDHVTDGESKDTTSLLHKTIRKVSEDITSFKFNTAVSAMMIFVNQAEKSGLHHEAYLTFLKLLAPFAPHLTEELWGEADQSGSIHTAAYPTYDEILATDDVVTIGVQINGKHRGELTLPVSTSEAEAWQAFEGTPELQSRVAGNTIKKIIYVPGRILNVIIDE